MHNSNVHQLYFFSNSVRMNKQSLRRLQYYALILGPVIITEFFFENFCI